MPASTRSPRVLPRAAAAVLPALIVALAVAGQTRMASAATQTSTMTTTGFTCAGQLCPVVILSVGDTIDYVNGTTTTLDVIIVNVTPSTTSVAPGGKWSYHATTQLHDAQVVAKTTLSPVPITPLVLITQLLTVNPLSTATASSTSSPTPTPTAPPASTTSVSSSATTQPSSSATPAGTPAPQHTSPTSSSSSTNPAAGAGGIQGGPSGPVPAGPGDGSLLGSGGVQAVQTGGSVTSWSWWWLFLLLCGITAAAAFATWWGTRRNTDLATVSVPSETERPGNDGGPPSTHHAS